MYAPAEDTFFFLDALQKDWQTIETLRQAQRRHMLLTSENRNLTKRMHFRPTLSLEMGCGSGIVSNFVAQNLRSRCFVT